MPPKPKENYSGGNGKSHPKDNCQTPPYAVAPLVPYLDSSWMLWECAAGMGVLADALLPYCLDIIATDIQETGDDLGLDSYLDFLDENLKEDYDAIITNPPFSLKYRFLQRCYEIGKPFALLMPIDTLGAQTAQHLFDQYGVEVLIMDKRIDFIMPNKGDQGTAQFNSAWFTWGLNIGRQLTFTSIAEEKRVYNAAKKANV